MDRLSAEELAVTRAPKWPYALLVLIVAGLVLVLWKPVATFIIIRQIEGAETAEQQAEALCRMNRWARKGFISSYGFETLDAQGRSNTDAPVVTLVLSFGPGSEMRVRMLGQHVGLRCALHG